MFLLSSSFRSFVKFIPNILTSCRFFAIIIIIFINYITIVSNSIFYTLLIFLLASITDFLDGYIARFFNVQSELGKLLDPIADKVLTSVMFLFFIEQDIISGISIIAVIVIFIRELMITGLRDFTNDKKINLNVSFLGKTKTLLQFVLIVLLLVIQLYNLDPISGNIFLWLVSFITLVSGIHYYCVFFATHYILFR